MDWLSQFPDNHFRILLDDPEYGINAGTMAFTRETKIWAKQKNGNRSKVKKQAYEQKDWDKGTPPQEYFDEVRRVCVNYVMLGVEYFDWDGIPAGRLKWDKLRPEGLSFKDYEMAMHNFDDQEHVIKCLHNGMMRAKSVHEPTAQQGDKSLNEKRIHVCQKPTILWKLILREFNYQPDWNVGAPNFGSATSRRACYDYGLDWEGVEREESYFNSAEVEFQKHKRITDLKRTQLKLF